MITVLNFWFLTRHSFDSKGFLESPNLPPTIPILNYKLTLVGRSGVGKTSLVSYFAGKPDWCSNTQETPGIRYSCPSYHCNLNVKVLCWAEKTSFFSKINALLKNTSSDQKKKSHIYFLPLKGFKSGKPLGLPPNFSLKHLDVFNFGIMPFPRFRKKFSFICSLPTFSIFWQKWLCGHFLKIKFLSKYKINPKTTNYGLSELD